MTQLRFGIDLGGTKIEILGLITADNKESQTVYQKRINTPKGNYLETVNAIVQLVLQAEAELKSTLESTLITNTITSKKITQTSILPGLVGIGIPGAISSKTGKIKNANSTWLMGKDLQADLQSALNRPVKLANDANCFALSEATDGAAKGANVVFGVIIGTGCGGGIVINGQILNGINAIGGEWGA